MKKITLIKSQELSRAIYRQRTKLLYRLIRKLNINKPYIFSVLGNDRAIIGERNNRIIIAIAGSDDLGDWRENFQIKTIKEIYRAYKGFALPALNIFNKLQRVIKINNWKDKKVFITGHSRGGAIGIILHRLIEDSGMSVVTYTFGAPPSGGVRFKRNTKGIKDVYEFKINGDPVPKINPFGKHIGIEIKLPRQIKGFFHRLRFIFKGNMNHTSYSCIRNYQPFNIKTYHPEDFDIL